MDQFPTEILALIAKLLPFATLQVFRLVSRRLADIAYPLLVQHLSVVSTVECLNEFKHFISQNPETALYTKKLTIYHGTWPVCTRDAWETHPLLLGGCDRMDVGSQRSHIADQAYQDYKDFVLCEGSRKPSDLLTVLQLFPNLKSITLTHIRASHVRPPQYSRLRKKIWLQPYVKDSVSPTVTWVLGTLINFPRITEIEINGNFNPYDIDGPVQTNFIESLKITCMKCSNHRNFLRFLSCFSRLRNLSLEMRDIEGNATIPLDKVLWPNLETVELTNGRISEKSIVAFIQHHTSLSSLRAQDTTIVGGSWESVLQGAPAAGAPAALPHFVVHTSRFPEALN